MLVARVHPRRVLRIIAIGALAAGCTAPPIPRTDVQALLDAQVEHWNAGDLPAFVATCWDGPGLTPSAAVA